MRSMCFSSSSATHHISFPPRLEVAALKKRPNGLSTGSRHELALDRFLGNQPHRPARSVFGRITAHHGNDALFFAGPEQGSRSRPLFVVERSLEASLLIASANLPHRLGAEMNMGRHLASGLAGIELQQRQRPQHGAHGLDSLPRPLAEFIAVTFGKANGKAMSGAHGLL